MLGISNSRHDYILRGETVELKPGQYASVDNDGLIVVDNFDIPSKAKDLIIPMEILIDDGYLLDEDYSSDSESPYLDIENTGKDSNKMLIYILPLVLIVLVLLVIVNKKSKGTKNKDSH